MFATVAVACNDPGAGSDVSQVGTYRCPFTEPGNYTVRVTVKNVLGIVIYAVTKRVKVDAPIERFRLMTSIYNGVNERLKAGNIDGAVSSFTNTIRETYRAAFTVAGSALGAMVDGFGAIKGMRVNGNFAEMIVVRNTVDGEIVFSIFLLQDSDGTWRIDGF